MKLKEKISFLFDHILINDSELVTFLTGNFNFVH